MKCWFGGTGGWSRLGERLDGWKGDLSCVKDRVGGMVILPKGLTEILTPTRHASHYK